MIDVKSHIERRERLRRSSDRQFVLSLIGMFALTFLLGWTFGYYVAMREVSNLVEQSNAADTHGIPASHRSPDVEK